MAVVTEDLKAGYVVNEDRGSFTATRVFYVTGLVQAPEHQIMEALNDPGIPPYLEKYPPFDSAGPFPEYDKMLVRTRRGEPYGKNGVRVEINYSNVSRASFSSLEPPAGNEGPDLKRISSGVDIRKTTTDRAGNKMVITPTGKYTGAPPHQSTAETFIPVGELTFLRAEATPPASRMRTLVGKVNSLTLSAYAANTLLLASIEADSFDGTTWDVEYVFRYRADGWKHYDTWRDQSGKAGDGQDELAFDVLEEADFGLLGLDFSDNQSPW